mmetsp:Transcript_16660/g.40842  ORF Transcript_16660/g.40842 Transcript_16660/m.40842 type:complete len:383 (-) Transcript_16660:188-1336(-)
MRGVPRGLPQVEVEDVGGDDLIVLVLPVLLADERDERVVDLGAVGQEEARTGRQRVEEEQLLVHADEAVVALLGLRDTQLVLLHQLVMREGDCVNPHQWVVLDVGAPVRTAALVHCHALDPRRVGEVRAAAQVHHGPAAVARDDGVARQVADQLHLELVLREHLQRLVARHHDALERLLVFADALHALLDAVTLVVRQRALAQEAVIVEALLDGGADGEVRAVLQLQRLAQHVRGTVPVQLLALRVVEREQLQRAVRLQRPPHVPVLAVHVREERRLRQLLVDGHGDVPRAGHVPDSLLDASVGHDHLDGIVDVLRGDDLLALAREVLLEQLDALGVVRRLHLERRRPRGLRSRRIGDDSSGGGGSGGINFNFSHLFSRRFS